MYLDQRSMTPAASQARRGFVVPDGALHLADMALAQHEHTHARLAYAASYGEGELAVQEQLVIVEPAAVVAAAAASCLSRDSGSTRMPMLESSKARFKRLSQTRMSPLRLQSS